jgi:hypothetical protein
VSRDWEKFRSLLETEHIWPSEFTFKFIVPVDKLDEILSHIQDGRVVTRESSGGRYISVTIYKVMTHHDEVIEIYKRVAVIEGILSF